MQKKDGKDASEARETGPGAESLHHLRGQAFKVAHDGGLAEGLRKAMENACDDAPVEPLDREVVSE